jgi:hypothetical protein
VAAAQRRRQPGGGRAAVVDAHRGSGTGELRHSSTTSVRAVPTAPQRAEAARVNPCCPVSPFALRSQLAGRAAITLAGHGRPAPIPRPTATVHSRDPSAPSSPRFAGQAALRSQRHALVVALPSPFVHVSTSVGSPRRSNSQGSLRNSSDGSHADNGGHAVTSGVCGGSMSGDGWASATKTAFRGHRLHRGYSSCA